MADPIRVLVVGAGHMGRSHALAYKQIDGFEIECPRHGARFDVRTGAVCRMPAYGPTAAYEVTVENGFVFVDLPGKIGGQG